jgi:hypothetical protein
MKMKRDTIKKYIEGDATPDEKKQIVEWVKAGENNLSELLSLRKLHDITLWQATDDRQERRQKDDGKNLIIIK